MRQGRLNEARDALHRLADVAPREPHALCELAETELRSGQAALLEPAALDGSRAAALEPDCVRAQTVAGNAWLTRGDSRRAVEHLRRAVKLNPSDLPLTLHLAKTLLDAQRTAEAADLARGLVRRYPGFAEGYYLLATCYETYPPQSAEFRSVAEHLAKALTLEPTYARAQARTGYHLLAAGDARRALRHLEAARLLAPRDGSILFDLSRAYLALGRRAEAARVRQEFERGSALENEAAALEKRLLLDPRNERLYQRLEVVSRALGDPERVARARRRAAPGGTGDPKAGS